MAINIGCDKTSFIRNSLLNTEQLKLYLDFILEKNLLTKKIGKKGREEYVITPKGNHFVKDFFYSVPQGPYCPKCGQEVDSKLEKKWMGLANKHLWYCSGCDKDSERPVLYPF